MSRKALVLAAVVVAGIALGFRLTSTAQQPSTAGITVDADDIGGVVSGPKGPEAGVWVIAETTDLPTKFAKVVVTDDRGRYLLPDLPKANYTVWVRGTDWSTPRRSVPRRDRRWKPDGDARTGSTRRGPVLSGRLLVLADADSRKE